MAVALFEIQRKMFCQQEMQHHWLNRKWYGITEGLVLVRIFVRVSAGETMISGYTGEAFRTDIFIGPVYYQRLRHMVSDKFQVSSPPLWFNVSQKPLSLPDIWNSLASLNTCVVLSFLLQVLG